MEKSSHSSWRSAIPLLLIGTSLAGCSQPLKPSPSPVVIQCQPPLISPELLTPPPHQAIDRLLKTLGMPPVKLVPVSSDTAPSKPN